MFHQARVVFSNGLKSIFGCGMLRSSATAIFGGIVKWPPPRAMHDAPHARSLVYKAPFSEPLKEQNSPLKSTLYIRGIITGAEEIPGV